MPRPELEALRKQALAYPGAHEEFPWGERVVKVNKKIFVTLGRDEGEGWGISVKLPHSGVAALMLPFASPTHYGMGKHGWVTCRFGPKEKAPMPLLAEWVEESYRAIAPAKWVKQLDGASPPAPKKTPAKKPAIKARGRRST